MMKKILTTIVIAVSCAAAFSSCSKQNFDVDFVDPVDAESNDVTISLVSAQDQTKAFLLDDYTFRWDPSGEEAFLFETPSFNGIPFYCDRLSSKSFDLSDNETRANFYFKLLGASDYYNFYGEQAEAFLINNNQFKEGTVFSYDFLYPSSAILSSSNNEVTLELRSNQSPDEYSKVPGKNILLYSHLDASEVRLSGSETRIAEMQYQHLCSYARLNFTKFPSYLTYGNNETTAISVKFFDNEKKYTVCGKFDFDLSSGEIVNANTGPDGWLIGGTIDHVSDGEGGFKPQFDEYWFSLIPGTFQNSTMEVMVSSEAWDFELIKDIPVKSPFKAGKIKVFDLDFTTETTEVNFEIDN